jgi:hypothetical protein
MRAAGPGVDASQSATAQVTTAAVTTAPATTAPALAGSTSAPATRVEPRAVPAAGQAAGRPLYPLPAGPAYPKPCPPPPRPHPPYHPTPLGKPVVPESRVPAAAKVPKRAVDLRSVRGTGTWVTVFRTGHIDAAGIVRQSQAAHLTSIWIRVGSTREGFYGKQVLPQLLPLAHAAGLQVVGWDFPTLSSPVADAGRAWAALLYRSPSGDALDGFSPDIETASEHVFLTAKRVQAYLSRVQSVAGSRPVIATVYRPTDHWWSGPYPYHAEAPYVDAFAPMVYWSCTEPGVAVQQAVDRLRSLGRPVHVIGQAYDMGDEGGRPGLPTGRETWRFLDVAKRHGAVGASLYLFSQTSRAEWQALGSYPWS